MNTLVTVNFETLGIEEERAGTVFQDLQARVSRWWRDQRARKGRQIGALLGIHSHANPAGSRHVHWMTHVPEDMAADFAATVRNRLCKIIGTLDLKTGLHIQAVPAPGDMAKYVLRGVEPDFGPYLFIKPANEGHVAGCRRTGVSRAASKAARKRAGWTRRRRGRANRP